MFNLIENEQSPFVISRKGKTAVENLKDAKITMYRDIIVKNLSLRIIQQCRNFYKNIKLSRLLTFLPFYKTESEVERLIFEFNKDNLIHTTISFNENGVAEGFITFNPEH